MNLSSPFIHRPIATTLLAIAIAVAGVVAFNLLPVAPLPQIDFPTIIVQASLSGASAENMATSIATPLETQLSHIAGVTDMTSASSLGSTRIILQFDLSRDINGAARDVQAAINAAQSNLPANLPTNPTYREVNPSDAPIMIIALTSPVFTRGQMYDVASTILQQRLSQIDGIGQVIVGGSSLPAVRVELNPTQLNKYGIGLPDVAETLGLANSNIAKGELNEKNKSSLVMTTDQLFKAKQYAPLIIRYQNGQPVRIQDVGYTVDSIQDVRNAGLANGKPAVMLVLFKEPGANVISTLKQVRAVLPMLHAAIPTAMNMQIVMDRSPTIISSLDDVEITLVIAMILVVLVTYLFIGNFRAMLIPAIAVPLSLLGTFAVMLLLGYSLDNLSLMSLTIATGFVVDDAVVVLENISRHIEMGVEPLHAALVGAEEVGFTVLSMSLSLIAVFLPILLMGGIVGRLFREFSVTLSVAILISMVVSLTVTPAMCSRLLKQHVVDHHQNSEKSKQKNKLLSFRFYYEKSLQWSLDHAKFITFITILTIILNIVLFIIIPKGFFPQEDTGRITGSIQAEQNISFQALEGILKKYVSIIQKDPGVQNVVGFIGGTTVNSGSVYISLKPLNQRKVSADVIIDRLRGKLATVTGGALYLQSAQDLNIGARQGNAQFQYTLSGDSLELINKYGPLVQNKLQKLPGIADVNSDQRSHGLQMIVNVDRDTASRFGITSQLIDSTLYHAFGQSQVSTMYTNMNQYEVVMEVAPEYWQYPSTLDDIYVTSTAGNQVPLSAFANFNPSSTLLIVNHQGQAPSVTMSFNLLPGVALGTAVNAVGKAVKDMQLPPTIQASFKGSAQAFQASLASEPLLILAALFAIYVVLGMLYESLIHPVTILSTLPSAGVGALIALLCSHTDLNIIALIGIILLIGIVKKNAIMMIDFALQAERMENKTPKEAIYQAAVLRFRPIMMTTMAALLGAFPLVLAFGLGSELRQPLGITIVGGLIMSQMLTLYTTPVIYLGMGKVGQSWGRLFRFLFFLLPKKQNA